MKLLLAVLIALTAASSFASSAGKANSLESIYSMAYLSFLNEKKCQTLETDDVIRYAKVFLILHKNYDIKFESKEARLKIVDALERSAKEKLKDTPFYNCSDENTKISKSLINSLDVQLSKIYKK